MEDKKIPHTELINSDETICTSPGDWIKIKKVNNFYYSERKGIDSVAFVFFATNLEDTKRIGLLKEYKHPVNKAIVGAFGGSIDDEKYHEDLRTLIQDEAMEEAGFKVELEQISYYGKFIVSTQMNQFCHLFGISVDKTLQGEKTTTNPEELSSEVVWVEIPDITELEDWKAFLIVTKRMISANTKLTVRPIIS